MNKEIPSKAPGIEFDVYEVVLSADDLLEAHCSCEVSLADVRESLSKEGKYDILYDAHRMDYHVYSEDGEVPKLLFSHRDLEQCCNFISSINV